MLGKPFTVLRSFKNINKYLSSHWHFLNIHHHTKLQDPVPNGTSFAATSQSCIATMQLSLLTENTMFHTMAATKTCLLNYYLRCWCMNETHSSLVSLTKELWSFSTLKHTIFYSYHKSYFLLKQKLWNKHEYLKLKFTLPVTTSLLEVCITATSRIPF